MHELPALSKACDLAEEAARANNIERIRYVRLEVGELTGYLPVFFEKYFPVITSERPIFRDAELIMDVKKGEGMCQDCHSLYNIMKNEGVCPKCGSRNKIVLSGQEFKLVDIGG